MMKEQLQERLKKLREQRAEVVNRRTGELARLDDQIAFAQALVDNWDVFTIDEALAALAKTGVRIKLES